MHSLEQTYNRTQVSIIKIEVFETVIQQSALVLPDRKAFEDTRQEFCGVGFDQLNPRFHDSKYQIANQLTMECRGLSAVYKLIIRRLLTMEDIKSTKLFTADVLPTFIQPSTHSTTEGISQQSG